MVLDDITIKATGKPTASPPGAFNVRPANMDATEFVASWRREMDSLVDAFLSPEGGTQVAAKIKALNLSAEQLAAMRGIVNGIVCDTMYTLLLGLDGEANIGGIQQPYIIHDETGAVIAMPGEIEAAASNLFPG